MLRGKTKETIHTASTIALVLYINTEKLPLMNKNKEQIDSLLSLKQNKLKNVLKESSRKKDMKLKIQRE